MSDGRNPYFILFPSSSFKNFLWNWFITFWKVVKHRGTLLSATNKEKHYSKWKAIQILETYQIKYCGNSKEIKNWQNLFSLWMISILDIIRKLWFSLLFCSTFSLKEMCIKVFHILCQRSVLHAHNCNFRRKKGFWKNCVPNWLDR